MSNRNFIKLLTDNIDLNRIQDQVVSGTQERSAVGNGRQVTGLSIAAGATQEVPHGLGRRFQGAQGATGASNILVEQSSVDSSRFVRITNNGSAPITSLWVF